MKKLNTVVDDIYTSLNPLSEGKGISLSEDEIERTGENIKEALRQWSNPSDRNAQFNIRMSNIGRPSRQLWFENTHPNESNLIPSIIYVFCMVIY